MDTLDFQKKIESMPIFGKIIGIVIVVSGIIWSINEIIEKLFGINLLKKTIDFVIQINKDRIKSIQTKYYSTLKSKAYLVWQLNVMKKIYPKLDFVKIIDYEYPIYCLKFKSFFAYPFKSLLDKNLKTEVQNCSFHKSIHKKYKRMLGTTLKHPNVPGFMLDKLNTDGGGNIISVSSKVGTFEQNIYSSHILEYELFNFYKKSKDINKLSPEKILSYLPLRKNIHNNQSPEQIVLSGNNRFSLFGIQVFLIFKHFENQEYKVLSIQRSKDVAIRPDLIQFIPAGVFEIFQNTNDKNVIIKNYSVRLTFFRELLEEAFGITSFEYNEVGVPEENILSHPIVQLILDCINKNEAFFEFLGSIIDLTVLRHDLSFILRIDNIEFSKLQFMPNFESHSIRLYSISELMQLEKKEINPTSAGLLFLARQNRIFKEIQI